MKNTLIILACLAHTALAATSLRKALLALIASASFFNSAYAAPAEYTWLGGTSAVINVAANWVGGALPTDLMSQGGANAAIFLLTDASATHKTLNIPWAATGMNSTLAGLVVTAAGYQFGNEAGSSVRGLHFIENSDTGVSLLDIREDLTMGLATSGSSTLTLVFRGNVEMKVAEGKTLLLASGLRELSGISGKTYTLSGGGTIDLRNSANTAPNYTGSTTQTLTQSWLIKDDTTLDLSSHTSSTITDAMGTGAIAINGGTMKLKAAATTFANAINVGGGGASLTGATSLVLNGNVSVIGDTLYLATGSVSGTGTITLGGGTLDLRNMTAGSSISNSISGTGFIKMSGTNLLGLTSTSSSLTGITLNLDLAGLGKGTYDTSFDDSDFYTVSYENAGRKVVTWNGDKTFTLSVTELYWNAAATTWSATDAWGEDSTSGPTTTFAADDIVHFRGNSTDWYTIDVDSMDIRADVFADSGQYVLKYGGGNFSAATTFTVDGGSLYLQLANTHTGTTTVESGELVASTVNALGTGALLIKGGDTRIQAAQSISEITITNGTLEVSAENGLGSGSLTINGGTVDLQENQSLTNVVLNGSSKLEITAGRLDSASISVGASAALTLNGAHSCDISSSGTLIIKSASLTGGISMESGSTLHLYGTNTASISAITANMNLRAETGASLNSALTVSTGRVTLLTDVTANSIALTGAGAGLTTKENDQTFKGNVSLADFESSEKPFLLGGGAGSTLTIDGDLTASGGRFYLEVNGNLNVTGTFNVAPSGGAFRDVMIHTGSTMTVESLALSSTSNAYLLLGGEAANVNYGGTLVAKSLGTFVSGSTNQLNIGNGSTLVLDLDTDTITSAHFRARQGGETAGLLKKSGEAALTLTGVLDDRVENGTTVGRLSVAVDEGSLTISGASNSYSGTTTVSGTGELVAGANSAFGASKVTVKSGTLDLNEKAVSNDIRYEGGTITGYDAYTGTLTAGANLTLNSSFGAGLVVENGITLTLEGSLTGGSSFSLSNVSNSGALFELTSISSLGTIKFLFENETLTEGTYTVATASGYTWADDYQWNDSILGENYTGVWDNGTEGELKLVVTYTGPVTELTVSGVAFDGDVWILTMATSEFALFSTSFSGNLLFNDDALAQFELVKLNLPSNAYMDNFIVNDGVSTPIGSDELNLANIQMNGVTYNAEQGGYFVQYIPEPSTVTMSLLALAGLAARRRRKA